MWKQAQAGIMSDALTVHSAKSGKSSIKSKRRQGAAGTQEKKAPRYQGTNQDFLSMDPSPPTPTSPSGRGMNVMNRLFNRNGGKKGTNQTLATGADNYMAGESKPIEVSP